MNEITGPDRLIRQIYTLVARPFVEYCEIKDVSKLYDNTIYHIVVDKFVKYLFNKQVVNYNSKFDNLFNYVLELAGLNINSDEYCEICKSIYNYMCTLVNVSDDNYNVLKQFINNCQYIIHNITPAIFYFFVCILYLLPRIIIKNINTKYCFIYKNLDNKYNLISNIEKQHIIKLIGYRRISKFEIEFKIISNHSKPVYIRIKYDTIFGTDNLYEINKNNSDNNQIMDNTSSLLISNNDTLISERFEISKIFLDKLLEDDLFNSDYSIYRNNETCSNSVTKSVNSIYFRINTISIYTKTGVNNECENQK